MTLFQAETMRFRHVPMAGLLLLTVVTITSCTPQRTIGALTRLGAERIEELASFRCVTEETAATVRNAFAATDPRYAQGQQLYENTRRAYNSIIEGIARDVLDGRRPDATMYWDMFGRAVDTRTEFAAFAQEEASPFGFLGLAALVTAAEPFATRLARQYLENEAREYVSSLIIDRFLLPPFAEAARGCADG